MPTRNLIFNGGIPLAPDIKRLEEEFGVPGEGKRITWEQMEHVLGISRKTNRFKSVYAAWKRKLFREHNAVVVAIGNNQGAHVLTPDERATYAVDLSEQGGRKIRYAIIVAETTDTKRLTNPELIKSLMSVVKLRGANLEIYRHVQPKELPSAQPILARN